jgi:hypothetical protein
MIDPPRRHYRTFFQTSHLETSFLILKRVPDVNYCMTHEELEILSYVRVHNIELSHSRAPYIGDEWLRFDSHINHRVYIVDSVLIWDA